MKDKLFYSALACCIIGVLTVITAVNFDRPLIIILLATGGVFCVVGSFLLIIRRGI